MVTSIVTRVTTRPCTKKHTYFFKTRCISHPIYEISADSLEEAMAIYEAPSFFDDPRSEEVSEHTLTDIYDESDERVGPVVVQPLLTLPIPERTMRLLLRHGVDTTQKLADQMKRGLLGKFLNGRELTFLRQILEALHLYEKAPQTKAKGRSKR